MTAKGTLETIFDSAPDAIIVTNDFGEIVMANKLVQHVFGYRAEELLGKKVELLIPQHLKKRHQHHRKKFMIHPMVREMGNGQDLQAIRKDKTVIDVEISLSHIAIDNQKLVMASVRDITEKKLMANQLKNAIRELEFKNKELEQFAYITSHDLREPLRSIAILADLLQQEYKDKLDANAVQYLKFMVESSNRMRNLIQSLLEYSLVGRKGKFVMVDLNPVMLDVLADLNMQIEDRKAQVTFDHLPTIYANEIAMRELFQNLIANAIKYCKRTGIPIIHIAAKQELAEYVFSIQDNGIGIDPQFFSKIFMMFQQLHQRNEYEGVGIGLAHSKKIVEMHGGRIWVASELNKGSTFYFSIPNQQA